jgi:RTX calcium-binding nonapeptide repeat (4 copies)
MSRPRRKPARRLRPLNVPERLEDRTLLAINLTGVPSWVEQGPGPIVNAQNQIPPDNAVAGAIQGLAPDPVNPNVLIAGGANGGLWKTSNALDADPNWTPLTDQFPSLTMGAIAYSPFDPTPTSNPADDDLVIYAGTGVFSNTGAGTGFGVLKSTDGGSSWNLLGGDTFDGISVNSIVPTTLNSGQVVLAATRNGSFTGTGRHKGGLYRSADGGVKWTRISGNTNIANNELPDAGVSCLVGDPANPNHFYAGVIAAQIPGKQGVYESVDGGNVWTPITSNLGALLPSGVLAGARVIQLSVSAAAPNPLYASVINNKGDLAGVFRRTGGTWATIGTAPAVSPGHQGVVNSSLLADPVDPDLVYVGGDRQRNSPFVGNLFVGDASNNTWNAIVLGGANNTAPHADSRRLVVAADGSILESDDGGIYRLSNPRDPFQRVWTSLNSGLRTTEFVSVAYDPLNNDIIGGAQDLGVSQQSGLFSSPTWTTPFHGLDNKSQPDFAVGDGNTQAVDASDPNRSIRYSMQNNFSTFYRSAFDASDTQLDIGNTHGRTNQQDALSVRKDFLSATVLLSSPATPGDWLSGLNDADFAFANSPAFNGVPFVLNDIDPKRLLIGRTGLYESLNQGDTIRNITPAGMPMVTALAYGGFDGIVPNADLAYVGAGPNLYLRTSATSGFQKLTGYATFAKGAGTVASIAIDPFDWHSAYIITGQHVFRGTGVGTRSEAWTEITGNLRELAQTSEQGVRQVVSFKSIQVVRTGGREVLLLGSGAGVFRLVDPASSTAWRRFGAGLPNTTVMSVVYNDADDVLVVGTQGRGAWTVPNASAALLTPGDLQITFDTDHDTIRLSRDASNPRLLDIFVNGASQPTRQFVISDVRHITVIGQGGTDALRVDSRNGVVWVQDGIDFVGGGGLSSLDFITASGDVKHVNPGSSTAGNVVVEGALGGTTGGMVNYTDVAVPPAVPILQSPDVVAALDAIRNGLFAFAPASREWVDATMGAQAFPVLGTSLAAMLNGEAVTEVVGESDEGGDGGDAPAQDDSAGDAVSTFLQRLLASGPGGFAIGDIGTTITTLGDLRARLAALDAGGGSVSLIQDETGIRFDVLVHQTLSGPSLLEAEAESGNIDLSGTVDVSADVAFHLIFGVDANGFYIDPVSTQDPMLTVTNLMIDGDIQGDGQFGFTDVLVTDGTLSVDPSVNFTLNVNQVAADPYTGQFDHRIRLNQLDPTTQGITSAQWQGGSNQDVVFSPTLTIAPTTPDGDAPFSLGANPAQVTLTWADVTAPDVASESGDNAAGVTLLDLLNLSAGQIIGGLADLGGDLSGLLTLNGSVMGSSFGVTGSLGSILGGPVSDVSVVPATIERVSPVNLEAGSNKFVVYLSQDLPAGSASVGDTVTYTGLDGKGASKTFQGTIAELGIGEFTVRFDGNVIQTPDPAHPGFSIAHSGSLQHQLQASLRGLIDPAVADAEAPTLQNLLLRLSDLTGVDPDSFQVSLNGAGASLGLQFGIDFHPQSVSFNAGVDLASLVPGLHLGSANDLAFTVDPQIHLVAGLLMAPGVTGDRFYLATDSTPTVSLTVSAAPTVPISGSGTVGYLNVALSTDNSIPNNPGLSIAGTVTASLADPGTDANDDRVSRAELAPANLSTLFTSGISQTDPLVVNVPGLLVTATVGSAPPSPIHVSLDGATAGRLTTLSALANLSTNAPKVFTVNGVGNFAGYNNISPDTVVQALAALAQQLGVAGSGGVFGAKLPVIGQSLSDVINLAQQFRDQVNLPTAADVPTAQDLLNFLVNHLGMSNVGLTAKGGELDIHLSFGEDVAPKSYTVGLGLGSTLSGLVSTSSHGQVTLRAHSDVNLAFGIATSGAGILDRVFIDTNNTNLSVSAQADAGYDLGQGAVPAALTFSAGIGPLSVGVSNARVLLRPSFDAHLNPGPSVAGQVKLSELSPGSVTGSLDGDAQAIIPIQGASGNAEVEVTGLLAQVGSISFPTDDDPNYTPNPATSPVDPSSINGFTVFVHHTSALLPTGNFNFQDVNLDDLTNGLGSLLDPIHTLLNSNTLGKISLPLIGKLGDAAKFIDDIKNALVNALTNLKNTNPSPTPDQVQTALLNDSGVASLISSNALTVVANQDEVEVKLHVNHSFSLASIPLAVDFGFPGLNFKIDPGSSLNIDLPVDFALGFGYSQKDGVFLDTDAAQSFGMTHTLTVGLTAGVQNLHATGQLGFLRLSASPIGNTSPFSSSLQFHVDLTNPVGDNHLTTTVLAASGLGDVLSASLSGSINVGLHLAADFGTDEFPGVSTDFQLAWGFGAGDGDPTMAGGTPTVRFSSVKLDLGTFFSGEVFPIIQKIQSTLGPLKPIFDFLVKPIPVISDLKGSPYTVLDAAGYGYLDTVATVVDYILNLPLPPQSSIHNFQIDLGGFDLGGSDIRSLPDLSGVLPANITSVTDAIDQIKNSVPGNLEVGFLTDLETQASTSATDGLHFPLLENPKTAFNLLLGKPVDLVEFGLPDIDVQDHESEFFPILGPIGVRLIGDLVVHTKLVFGYDTAGFMENPIKPLDGFFIDATSHVSVHADVEADLELNVVVAQAGVGGGVKGDVTIGLNDPNHDGKLRLGEISDELSSNPLSLFTAQGKVEAFLHAYVQVGLDTPFGFVGWSDSYDLAHTTLLDFDTTKAAQPQLGRNDSGTLTLFMGPNAGNRQNVIGDSGGDGGPEVFTVSQTPGGSTAANSEDVTVTYRGVTQKFTGVNRIYVEGGAGDNTITIKPDVTAAATLFAAYDSQDPNLTAAQRAYNNAAQPVNSRVTGGAGTTSITGGPGDNELSAGTGQTTIIGGFGHNIIFGGTGHDTLTGGAGNNEIYGGSGGGTLTGGGGTNLIRAGTGDDILIAGGPNSNNTFLVVNPVGAVLASKAGGLIVTGGGKSNVLELTDGGGAGYTETYTYAGPTAVGSPTIVTTNGTITQNVRATSLTTVADTVTVNTMTFNAPSAVDPIQIVNGIENHTGQQGDTSSAGTLTSIALGNTPSPLVNFSHKTGVSVIGGTHVTVNNPTPADGLKTLTLDGGTTIDLWSTAVGVNTVVLDTSGAASTVTVGKQGNTTGDRGPITVGSNSGHHTTLIIDDSAAGASKSPIISDSLVSNLAPVTVQFVAAGIQSLTVKGGTVGDIFNVVSTGGGYTTNLIDGPGADVVNVGSLVLTRGGVVNFLVGLLNVSNLGGADVMNVDDTGSSTSKVGTLSSTMLTGLGMGQGIRYSGLTAVNIRLGSGGNTFTVAGTHTGTTLLESGTGDDTVHVQATSGPTTVDTQAGNDLVNVGDGSLNAITSTAQSAGPAPLGLIGGAGHDAVVLDDSSDTSTGETGNLTSFLENRPGTSAPLEVGVLSGLGMTQTGPGGSTPGRVEFETFEASEVRLNRAGSTLTVGGDALRASLAASRLANITRFDSTINGMTVVTGGPAGDTVNVVDTNTLDRPTLDAALGLVSHTTVFAGGPGQRAVQQVTTLGKAHSVGFFTLQYRYEQTRPIPFGASDAQVHDALVALYLIGLGLNHDNVDVSHTTASNGDIVYTLQFKNELANKRIDPIMPLVAPLVLRGGIGIDHLNVQSVREETFYQGGDGDDAIQLNVDVSTPALTPLTSNGINAHITVDGEGGGDTYEAHLVGGTTASLVNVSDSGATGDGSDSLNVYGTAQADQFLLRAGAGQGALAFIALLNADASKTAVEQPVERVNYDANLEHIHLDAGAGNDSVYVDDTRAQLTIDGGAGDDFFQIGQLYQTARTPALAGLAEPDIFTTIETTKGWLSNGVSEPTTINGGDENDTFIVFHNTAVLNLNGEDGNDTFIVQAFALVGSQDNKRAMTDVSGGAGADLIRYAVDAEVNIDGGDGLDTVIVIGTEFEDDFVVSSKGIYGAGLNVNYINIERLVVDGAEGDDRFFILGTGPDLVTEIDGGLGSDLFQIGGPTPANGVASRNLRGHGGLISHNVVSTDPSSTYNGIDVKGVSANVADNDTPAVIVTESDGHSIVTQGGGYDTFSVALSRPPVGGGTVTVNVQPPKGLVFLDGALNEVRSKSDNKTAVGVALQFHANDWFIPQVVRFEVDTRVQRIPDIGDILMNVVPDGVTGSIASAANLDDKSNTATLTRTAGSQPFPAPGTQGLPEGLRGELVTITDAEDNPEAVGQTRLILSNTADTLTVDQPWSVVPPQDAVYEIRQFSGQALPSVRVRIYSEQKPEIVVDQSEGYTSVAENPSGTVDNKAVDTVSVRLSHQPLPGETVSVNLDGSGRLQFARDASFGTLVTSLSFNALNYDTPVTLFVRAIDDQVVQGTRQIDLVLTATSSLGGASGYAGQSRTITAEVADNDAPGVRVLESNGSTDVVEGGDSDSYQLVLTSAPAAGETVTVNAVAEPSRTDGGGGTNGLRSFTQTVLVSTDNVHFGLSVPVTFDNTNWSTPRTIYVKAVDNSRVDGNDTTLFPEIPAELDSIRGPLILRGGPGEDRTGLLEREPVMLPGERNAAANVGSVVRSTEAAVVTPATVTIDPSTLKTLSVSALANLGITISNPANLQPSDIVHLSIRITDGKAKNKVRVITGATDNGDGSWTLTLNHSWFSPFTNDAFTPDGTSRFTLSSTNPNLLVDERDQTDVLQANDTANVSSYNDPNLTPNPLAVGRMFFDNTFTVGVNANNQPIPLNMYRIVGLGMGGDRSIGGQAQPGGIAFDGMEDVGINLGPGNDHFTIDSTPSGAITRLDADAGDDLVDVKSVSGHTFINLGAGKDAANVHNDQQQLKDLLGLLTIMGDVPQATVVRLAAGSPADGTSISAVNEIQQVTVDATGGTFRLSLDGASTGPLAYNISPADLKAALGALSTIGGAANVSVTRAGNVYRITFVAGKAGQAIDLLTADDLSLTNGLGERDVVNVSDSGTTSATSAALTPSSLTGLSAPQVNEIQSIFINATQGTFRLSYGAAATAWLPYDATASVIQAALLGLSGGTIFRPGDVVVTRNDKVVVVRFQGNLSQTNVAQIVATAGADLLRAVEQPGGGVAMLPGLIQVSTRVDGTSASPLNDVQVLTVNATGGSFALSLLGGTITTAPIRYDASADELQSAFQAAFAKIDPSEAFKIDVTVSRYANVYLIGFQGKLRRLNGGKGVDLLAAGTSNLLGTATVASRVDGLNYYGVETLNVDFGSGNDVLNVQGTTAGSAGFAQGGGVASTNIALHDGNGQIFVSSNADLDLATASADLDHNGVPDFDFLTGTLAGVGGALNLDAGTGLHRLMISNEAATVGAADARITRRAANLPGANPTALGLDPNAAIWVTGLAPAGLSYKAAPTGNFFDGVTYWTGAGDDHVAIDGSFRRTGGRTMTLLNTGLGNDRVNVSLTAGQDDFLALNAMGGASSVEPSTLNGPVRDDDTVDASASTLPLVIFGGMGNDNIIGGQASDIILGDFGRVQYADPMTGQIIASLGAGGRGDFTSSQVVVPAWIYSRDRTLGGNDTIQGDAGQDVLIGGAANDMIDGGLDNDLIFGDAVRLQNRTTTTNPRFQTLKGTRIYADASLDGVPDSQSGQDMVSGVPLTYRTQDATATPWASYQITNLYQSAGLQAQPDNSFGNDYIAGGGGNDMIFGQLGNDIIQGDGSIASALAPNPTPVGAFRNASGALVVTPSFEAATDGSDYIEGGGGNDAIFGGLGQDDIIGGSSDLFSLTTPDLRPDGNDLIFGGAGTRIDRNNQVTSPNDALFADQHARDADAIVGDNGDIFRLVGANGVDGGSFLTFNYDTTAYGQTRIVPRVVRLLDYTPGGGAAAANDIGGPDEFHGEAGDDVVYSGKGDDVLFGDAGNDDLVGGYGNDWISGGTGDDGILGDDGRIFTSRNGLTEPLYGLTTPVTPQTISTPGNIQNSTINAGGLLTKAVDVLAYGSGGNDILFGGLGNDSVHGGAGDDAVSGAETPVNGSVYQTYAYVNGTGTGATVESDFSHPVNYGNNLGYDPTTTKFVAYDAYHPMQKLPNFFLNFTASEGNSNDGNDVLFGDIGNDWLVGGTGNDHAYGGAGDDLLNADDNLDTDNGLNDAPDPSPYNYGDIAYGGSGLDVLIANTSNDRLIDWVGEFNSYLVPFSPFGMPTVSRTNQPQLPEYLYALSKSDGADQTRTTAYNGGVAGESTPNVTYDGIGYGDPARNGEPYGELGLVRQQDPAWQAQTGAPRDPQAGNTPGTKRDTMFQSSFNNNSTLGFFPDSGTWSLGGGSYTSAPASRDSAVVIGVDQWLPTYIEFSTTASLGKSASKQNAFLLFNYQGQGNFMYAGIDAKSDQLRIGQRTAAGWVDLAQLSAAINANANYPMTVAISGTTVTLTVGSSANAYTLQYTFPVSLGGGMLGLGTDSGSTSFSNVLIQRVPPAFTFSYQASLSGGAAPNFTPLVGQWAVANNLYTGSPDATGAAVTTRSLAVAPSSYLGYSATVNTRATAGLVFDDYGPTNFKFAAVVAGSNQVVIGHRTSAGWFTDSVVSQTLTPGVTYTLKVALLGKTATVSLNGTSVLGYAFSELLNDAGLGMLARGGPASFGSLLIQGDDPAYSSGGFNLSAASAPAVPDPTVAPLTANALTPMIAAAIRRWVASGAIDAKTAARLADVQFQIADLPGRTLGREVGGTTIQIDATAAGFGWFVDATPYSDSEFQVRPRSGQRRAIADRMDLLSVVMHELGHARGLSDLDNDARPGDVMDETLSPGVRRLPTSADAPAATVVRIKPASVGHAPSRNARSTPSRRFPSFPTTAKGRAAGGTRYRGPRSGSDSAPAKGQFQAAPGSPVIRSDETAEPPVPGTNVFDAALNSFYDHPGKVSALTDATGALRRPGRV